MHHATMAVNLANRMHFENLPGGYGLPGYSERLVRL